LGQEETSALAALMDRCAGLAHLYCTGCEYCLPCPSGVSIPRCFELFNYLRVYGIEEYALDEYEKLVQNAKDASQCAECGTCEERCPQNLPIRERLKEVAEALRRA